MAAVSKEWLEAEFRNLSRGQDDTKQKLDEALRRLDDLSTRQAGIKATVEGNGKTCDERNKATHARLSRSETVLRWLGLTVGGAVIAAVVKSITAP